MFYKNLSTRLPFNRYFTPIWVTMLALLLSVTGASAEAQCLPVHGNVVAFVPEPPACGEQLCNGGTFNGGIQGDFVATGEVLVEQPDPAVAFYTASTTASVQIGNKHGTLQISNAGVAHNTGRVLELDTITGGTEDLLGASGLLYLTGTADNQTGQFVYSGEICLP